MIKQINIDDETLQDLINIETGVFSPLEGFMREDDYRSVLDNLTLESGSVFTIPITLDVPKEVADSVEIHDEIEMHYNGKAVASIVVESSFVITEEDIYKIYLTRESGHPGVRKEMARNPYRIGGKTRLLDTSLLEGALKPEVTRRLFDERGWNTVVGFQTRNPIHKAHEHIQRLGLEICDGLFVNPIIGWKKQGDFTEEAVMAAYNTMIEVYYPKERVYLAGLKTQMRYAGPREAVFHAIIRRNLGCTHFIIGRDHAGVGGYYGAYDAHDLANKIICKHDLGIQLILSREPYYCEKCSQIVTDKTCSHYYTNRVEISGTIIRKYINDGYIPDEVMMRREIFEAIRSCERIFI